MSFSFLLFLCLSFLILDFYTPVLIPTTRLGSVQTRGNWCFLYVTAKSCMRRKMMDFFMVILFLVYCAWFEHSLLPQALFILFYSLSATYLSYTPGFYILKCGFFVALSCFIFFSLSSYSWALLLIYGLYFLYRIINPEFSFYQVKNVVSDTNSRASFYAVLMVTILILSFRVFVVKYPIEQFLLLFVMIIGAQLESRYKDHKLYLKTCQNRYHLSLIRSSQPSFDFLSIRQKNDYLGTLGLISVVFCALLFVSQYRLDLLIAYMGVVAQMLLNFDIITQHYLLKRSIVYNNVVTLMLADSMMSGFVFIYIMYYSILKSQAHRFDFFLITVIFRSLGLIVFASFIFFFVYRLRMNRVGENK